MKMILSRYDDLVEERLEGEYWVVDILPSQVPKDAKGQYFAVDRYFIQPERLAGLYHRYGEILLKLNCYYDMSVTFDGGESWEMNPDPEQFSDKLIYFKGNEFLRAVFEEQKSMIDIDFGYTDMTVYTEDPEFLDKVKKLTEAEGFFIWIPASDN